MCPAQAAPAAPPPTPAPFRLIPFAAPQTLSPGQITLLELEGRFADAVAKDGGKGFAAWFAEDAVILNNGKPALRGRGAIAAQANWDPTQYKLTWTPQGADMGPSNDMGYTWGSYQSRSPQKDGKPVAARGRYITIWKKQADGTWKVQMDASASEPPGGTP